ncbi:MAG: orotidine-5'-phosphate decarboxylase [Pseudomonadota bacterium]|nr:orotidine-5'-phosphate decarboxylase [Pseudomonadota bacterium]
MYEKNIIVALDYDDENKIYELCSQLDPSLCRVKIGKQAFTKFGPELVKNLQGKGFEIFLDLKFHDIPTTVYKACTEAFNLGVWMLNVHLLGGTEMVNSAREARDKVNQEAKIIGVTLLTSTTDVNLENLGLKERSNIVKKLAIIASKSNIDGVVCTPKDINLIREIDRKLLFITPGIRLDANKNEHSQVFSPREAIKLGSNYIVIGRPIIEAKNPEDILQNIIKTINDIAS